MKISKDKCPDCSGGYSRWKDEEDYTVCQSCNGTAKHTIQPSTSEKIAKLESDLVLLKKKEQEELKAREQYEVPWEYCECGCHCLEARFSGVTMSLFIYLNDKHEHSSYRLSKSGGEGKDFTTHFKTREDVDLMTKAVILVQIKKSEEELERMKRWVSDEASR